MALMRCANGQGGGGGELDYEVITATLPAGASSINLPLTKGKMPKAVFMARSGQPQFNINMFGDGVFVDNKLYYYGSSSIVRQYDMVLSTTQIALSNMDTSGVSNILKVCVIY